MPEERELRVDSDLPAFQAYTEGGQTVDSPSEDAIFELLTELSEPDNTFLAIEQRGPGASPWRVVASLLPGDGFEIEYRDIDRGEHRVVTETSPDRAAFDLSVWVSSVLRRDE